MGGGDPHCVSLCHILGPTPEVTWGAILGSSLLQVTFSVAAETDLGQFWKKKKVLKCADLPGGLNSPPSHLAEPGKSYGDITDREQGHDVTEATLQGDTSGHRCRPRAAPVPCAWHNQLLSHCPPPVEPGRQGSASLNGSLAPIVTSTT